MTSALSVTAAVQVSHRLSKRAVDILGGVWMIQNSGNVLPEG